MVRRMLGGRGRGRVWLLVVVTLALFTLLAVAAQSALAYGGWIHDTTTGGPTSCSQCHPGGNVSLPGTNAACQSCHTTQTLRTGYNCWSCHAPGQSLAGVACNSCHLFSGGSSTAYNTAHSHPAHVGSNLEACTVCHNLGVNNPHHSTTSLTAPTCTTCHTSMPVGGAPVPHAAYVAGKVCVDCHLGVDPNHPQSANVKTPTLAFAATQPQGSPDVTLKGTLKNGTTALSGVTVFLQSTPDGTTFTDVTSVTTDVTGSFSYVVAGATPGLQYRAVAQGSAGPPDVLPAKKLVPVTVPLVKATISEKLVGPVAGAIRLGKSVTAKGVVAPSAVGQKVTLLIQKKNARGVYVKLTTKSGLLKTGSAYSILYKPLKRGAYRIQASIAKSATHTSAVSLWRAFKVK